MTLTKPFPINNPTQTSLLTAAAPLGDDVEDDFVSLQTYLATQIAPFAHQLDTEATALFGSFRALGTQQKILTPKLPKALGGLGLSSSQFQQFQSLMARYSGSLAFLQTQHQSAASFLLTSENQALRQTYLPTMATGETCLGVGFSQLRRLPAPLVAESVAGGDYRLQGTVPWVSGAGLFTEFVAAAVLPSGEAVFGLLPLVSSQGTSQSADRTLRVSEPMALSAMAATHTVQVEVENWRLPAEKVIGRRPAGWIQKRDRTNPLSPLGLIFGCTQASLDSIATSLQRRNIEHSIHSQLSQRLYQLQKELTELNHLPENAYTEKINFRGRAISLMNTSAQAAIISASGAANALTHPAQRIYRESLVFSVSGQTTDGAVAALNGLIATAPIY